MKRTILGLFVAVTALVAVTSIPAFAASPPHAGNGQHRSQTHSAVTVALTADCSSLPDTQEAHAFAAQHGICGYGSNSGGGGGVQPNGTVAAVGDCGSLTLATWNQWSGQMTWTVTITSSLGPIQSVGYGGDWHNLDTDAFGWVSGGSSWMFSSSWSDYQIVSPGQGLVRSEVYYAEDHLWIGMNCKGAYVMEDTRVYN